MKRLSLLLLSILLVSALFIPTASAADKTWVAELESVSGWDATSFLAADKTAFSGSFSLRIKPFTSGYGNDTRSTTIEPYGALTYTFNNTRRCIQFEYDNGVIPKGDYTATFWLLDSGSLLKQELPWKILYTFHDVDDGKLCNSWNDSKVTIACVTLFDMTGGNTGAATPTGKTETVNGKTWAEYKFPFALSKDATGSAIWSYQDGGTAKTDVFYIDKVTVASSGTATTTTQAATTTTKAATTTTKAVTTTTAKAAQTSNVIIAVAAIGGAALIEGLVIRRKKNK